MNILQVSQNYFVDGGSDSYFFALSSLLSERSHCVIPFAPYSDKNRPTHWDKYFPKTYKHRSNKISSFFEYMYSGGSSRSLMRLLDDQKIDIAHLHIYYGGLTASILAPLKKANIPIIQTLHEYKLVCPVYTLENQGNYCNRCVSGSQLNGILHKCKNGSILQSTIRVTENLISRVLGDVRLIDRFISVSDFHRNKMIEGGVPSHKLVTVHNFVDTKLFNLPPEDEAYALYFGRIEKIKGIGTLLQAFKHIPLKLVIAGEGSALGHFKDMAAALQLNNVTFVGFKSGDDLKKLISNSRFCIVPSEWYENCPMSVLEAMALGKAVVASDIGGIPELVRDGIDGYLFTPKSVEDLTECCLKLSDKTTARDMGANAQDNVNVNFSKDGHYKKILEVYRDALSQKDLNSVAKMSQTADF